MTPVHTRPRHAATRIDESAALTKPRIIAELAKSPHGALDEYLMTGTRAANDEGEFFAHLISWNHDNGQVRDAKVALPIIHLAATRGKSSGLVGVSEFRDNALAHLALLSPRELVKATRWAKGKVGHNALASMVKRYLRVRETSPSWQRVVASHRASLHALYTYLRVKPHNHEFGAALFNGVYRPGTLLDVVSRLHTMAPADAVQAVIEHRVPFLVALGALGNKVTPDVGVALIERASPADLVTVTAMLERFGLNNSPEMRAAYDAKLATASATPKVTFKTTRAAEAVAARSGGTTTASERLRGAQERQVDALGRVGGTWLVAADKSGSMEHSIETSRQVAAVLARVADVVHLVFFDSLPYRLDVTGKSYDEITAATRLVQAGGGTSIGCTVAWAQANGVELDGVAIVSDGAEMHAPSFASAYTQYCQSTGREPSVYFYKVSGDPRDVLSSMCQHAGIDITMFDLTSGVVDYYALPNVVATMRANKYALVDEIMATPLRSLDTVLKSYSGG